tara:strand:+ start:25052 stop:25303 length:252 start_codon:yes stop_codon:yes gene_type:complete
MHKKQARHHLPKQQAGKTLDVHPDTTITLDIILQNASLRVRESAFYPICWKLNSVLTTLRSASLTLIERMRRKGPTITGIQRR